jgi:Fanconi anemia group M protein
VELKNLASADYILSGRVGVELKRVPDFVHSIIDGRLLHQVRELKKNFARCVLIIEGEEDIYSIRKVHPNAIRGMLASITIGFGVPVMMTKNPLDTAGMLAVIAKREQDKEREWSYHDRKPLSLNEQQEFIISSFPGIGVTGAKKLLEKFGSVKDIVNATKEELTAVEGIGEKTADRLIGLFERMYQHDVL